MASLSGLRRHQGPPAVREPTAPVHPPTLDLFPGIKSPSRDIYDHGAAMFGSSHHRRDEFERAAMVHVPELLRVASRLCGSADAGQDLLQETYLQAWRAFHRFETGTNC